MPLLRTVLLTVVVACAAPLCAAQWPCPEATVIYPCVCTADESFEMSMDCSYVTSTAQLAEIFQTHFPFPDFKQLTINPVAPSSALLELPAGVFGAITFEQIDITNTYIHTVEEETLVNSHGTLSRLNLAANSISRFPIETLALFTALLQFDISDNKLSGVIPDVDSKTLRILDLSGNIGLTLTKTAFEAALVLQDLRLNNMQLSDTTPPDVFKTLRYLKTLSLQNNGIPGTLIENLINPELDTLTTLALDNNQITEIHPLAITGMDVLGTVTLKSNNIEYLYQENWEGLVSQLSNADAIDIRDNPLVCGCEVKWLVADTDLLRIFHSETTCITGILLTELPAEWFLTHCP